MPRPRAAPAPPFVIEALMASADGSAVAVRAGGVPLGRVDPPAVQALGLRVGGTVDEPGWAALQAAIARRAAFDAGVRLLATRARSRQSVEARLRTRHGPAAAEHAVRRLAPYLDDAAFARDWVAERLRLRPLGPAALLAGLRREGVDALLARDVVAAATEAGGGELGRCAEAARRRLDRMGSVPPAKIPARLWSYLARRGFSTEVVAATLREVLPSADPDGPS